MCLNDFHIFEFIQFVTFVQHENEDARSFVRF